MLCPILLNFSEALFFDREGLCIVVSVIVVTVASSSYCADLDFEGNTDTTSFTFVRSNQVLTIGWFCACFGVVADGGSLGLEH